MTEPNKDPLENPLVNAALETSEAEKQALKEHVAAMSIADPEFAQQITLIGVTAHFWNMTKSWGKKFKAMYGSVAKTDKNEIKSIFEKLGIKEIFSFMGLFPYSRPQCAANVIAFHADEKGEIYVLVGQNKSGKWLTPQGFMDSLSPGIDDPANEKSDFDLDDTAKRELAEEAGVEWEEELGHLFEVMRLPRNMNPGGNDMTFMPYVYGAAFLNRPKTEPSKAFSRLEWVKLSDFAGDDSTNLNEIRLPDGETGTMPILQGEGKPYIYLVSKTMEAYLDGLCQDYAGVTLDKAIKMSNGFLKKPDYMTGPKGQKFFHDFSRIIMAIKKAADVRINPTELEPT